MVPGAALFSKNVLGMVHRGGRLTEKDLVKAVKGTNVKLDDRTKSLIRKGVKLLHGAPGAGKFYQVTILAGVYGRIMKSLPPEPVRLTPEEELALDFSMGD